MRHGRVQVLTLFLVVVGAHVAQAQETSEPFRRLDRNKDGQLTKDEFSGKLFEQLDANKDGVVSTEEDVAHSRRQPGTPGRQPMLPETVQAKLDLPYAATDNSRQRLDLYLPAKRKVDKPLPIVVFIHGGAWVAGDKRGGREMLLPLVESGDYAGVSVGYRLTGEAIWPAQIHDCKAAIRWLRANAKQ